ncbi:MAG: Crp/Fnr family transcriptional regulator [bacterium]
MDVKDFLKGMPVLAGLADEQLDRIAALGKIRQVKAGSMIDVQGEPAEKFYILMQGRVAVVLAIDFGVSKNSYIVLTVGPGEMFAWSGMVGNRKYTAGGEAQIDSTVVEFTSSELVAAFEVDYELGYRWMRAVAKTIASRMRHMQLQFVRQAAIRESSE